MQNQCFKVPYNRWDVSLKLRPTCLNCSSKLQFCCELKFCWIGLLLCWDEGVAGWEGGRGAGVVEPGVWAPPIELGRGENVVWGGAKPKAPKEAAVKGTRPWPPRPASSCELARKSLCLLKASNAGSGGRLARMLRGSNSRSSVSSLIKWRGSCNDEK